MSANHLDYLWDTYTHRFLAEGVHYRDMMDMRGEITSMDQWCPVWSAWAAEAEKRADQAHRRAADSLTHEDRVIDTDRRH